ncbi:hypothetical protein K4K58_001703 [Colletotrichum sp. SAR11_239]|nr:hypothetical protein K4K58_001703 [Colletotrichum sp. SAR11_239]
MDNANMAYQPATKLQFNDEYPDREHRKLVWVQNTQLKKMAKKHAQINPRTGLSVAWDSLPCQIELSARDCKQPEKKMYPNATQVISLGYFIPRAQKPEANGFSAEVPIKKLVAGKVFRVGMEITNVTSQPTTSAGRAATNNDTQGNRKWAFVLVGQQADDGPPSVYYLPGGRKYIFYHPEWLQGLNLASAADTIAEHAINKALQAGYVAMTGNVAEPTRGDRMQIGGSSDDYRDRAGQILPTDEHVILRLIDKGMSRVFSAETQEEKQKAAGELAEWIRRMGASNPLHRYNINLMKLVDGEKAMTLEEADRALAEAKVIFPLSFERPKMTAINAHFIQAISSILTSEDDVAIGYNELGDVFSILATIVPIGTMPSRNHIHEAQDLLRHLSPTPKTLSGNRSPSSTEIVSPSRALEHAIDKITRILATSKTSVEKLASRVAVASGGTTRMPPALNVDIIAELADCVGYDTAATKAEQVYALVVSYIEDFNQLVYDDPLRELKSFQEYVLKQQPKDKA